MIAFVAVKQEFKYLLIPFFIIQILLFHASGANPDSRLGTLASMKDQHSFALERSDWSMDTSVGVDGKIYSNKAPGPMLLAFPIFWLLDEAVLLGVDRSKPDEVYQKRKKSKDAYYIPLSLIFQIIPFAWISVLLVLQLAKLWNLTSNAQQATLAALLMGQSLSVFLNSFFGHGMAAIFLLFWLYYSIARKNYLAGISLGFALLCDYGAIVAFPIAAWNLLRSFKLQTAIQFLVGSALPATLWIWYHTVCFGSPFEIALMHQDPSMHLVANETQNFWGVVRMLPPLEIVGELIYGQRRGLLWTQPWIIVSFLSAIFWLFSKTTQSHLKFISASVATSLFLVTLLTASFGGWWGGGSTGPRYLSIVFPLAALLVGPLYDFSKGIFRFCFLGLLGWGVLFQILVFATSIHAPPVALWPWFLDYLLENPFRFFARLAVIALALLISLLVRMKTRKR
jgi:hypothetical protein